MALAYGNDVFMARHAQSICSGVLFSPQPRSCRGSSWPVLVDMTAQPWTARLKRSTRLVPPAKPPLPTVRKRRFHRAGLGRYISKAMLFVARMRTPQMSGMPMAGAKARTAWAPVYGSLVEL
jgi:hypothetical protein